MLAAEADWCPECCTRHDGSTICPGEVEATGDETLRTRTMFLTPRGWEIYGILLAPAGERWLARIASLPRTLWSVPDNYRPMKFLGESSEEVESHAARFIEEHCRKRGYEPIEDVTIPDPEDSDGDPLVHRRDGRSAERKKAELFVLWGTEEPTEKARTYNLSVDGLFLVTVPTVQAGTQIRIWLNLGDSKILVDGTVIWRRAETEEHRPSGMGVLLNRPPDNYIDFVRKL